MDPQPEHNVHFSRGAAVRVAYDFTKVISIGYNIRAMRKYTGVELKQISQGDPACAVPKASLSNDHAEIIHRVWL